MKQPPTWTQLLKQAEKEYTNPVAQIAFIKGAHYMLKEMTP